MFLPTVEKFLAREVVLEVSKLSQATRKSPSGPAVTFCPHNRSRWGNNSFYDCSHQIRDV